MANDCKQQRKYKTSLPGKYSVGWCFSHTCFLFKVQEEFLVEDECHAADLLYFGFRCGVPVDEVGRDGDRQLSPELLPFETWAGGKKALM